MYHSNERIQMFLETLRNLVMFDLDYGWFGVIMKTRSPVFSSVYCTGVITPKQIELH